MPSAVIVHSSLNALGGGERLALAIIEALKEAGWEVGLATLEKTDWARIESVWGRVPRPDREEALRMPRAPVFTIYKRVLVGFMVPLLRKRYDVVINTHGDVMLADTDITYMHFPTFMLWDMSCTKYEKGLWRLYFTPYYMLLRELVKRHTSSLLLTNSRYSMSAIHRVLGRRALVVYPPVDTGKFMGVESGGSDTVVSIGRFTPEKRYELVVEVAQRLPQYRFYIVGSTGNKLARRYYDKIRSMIEAHGLKNIELVPNASDKELAEILGDSKAYLHAMPHEHFGIAVVEAMAAGLVPVVHRSGGPWLDIIERGRYGYGYSSLEEAVTAVTQAMRSHRTLSPIMKRRARLFDKASFKKRILRVIETYHKHGGDVEP